MRRRTTNLTVYRQRAEPPTVASGSVTCPTTPWHWLQPASALKRFKLRRRDCRQERPPAEATNKKRTRIASYLNLTHIHAHNSLHYNIYSVKEGQERKRCLYAKPEAVLLEELSVGLEALARVADRDHERLGLFGRLGGPAAVLGEQGHADRQSGC